MAITNLDKAGDMSLQFNRLPHEILACPEEKPMSGIVLYGENSCGKTSVLHHLIVLLCGNGKLVPAIQAAFEEAFYFPPKDCYRDCDVIIPYRDKENNIVYICVSTDGDSWQIVEDNFRFFYHCMRSKQKAYVYDGKQFIQCDKSKINNYPRPQLCITPANFTQFGAIQAAHYYLELTCEDWQRSYWFRKRTCKQRGNPVAGYNKPMKKRIFQEDEKVALRMVTLIDQMLKETII